MNNAKAWEQEYRAQTFVTLDEKPQASVKTFLRWVKKEGVTLAGCVVVDVGCGTGRNANALAQMDAQVTGLEVSKTALQVARERAAAAGVEVRYVAQSMADVWPMSDASVDLVLDVTSSNALTARERADYVRELARVARPGGWLFVRTLAQEGDTHVKRLLRDSPGEEQGMYRLPGTDIQEHAFTREELLSVFSDWNPVMLKREAHYPSVGGRRFKRQYWISYWQKRV